MEFYYDPRARVGTIESLMCKNHCGLMRFKSFHTCCTHCKGAEGPHARDCANKQDEMKKQLGELSCSDNWYWGHVDSQVDPPSDESKWLDAVTLPLKLLPNHKYYRDFVRFARCPSFLDAKAKGHATPGCPFLGGTAYLRHADVKARLEQVADEHVQGTISRGNELGYFLLGSDAFPTNHTLCLGCSVEQHRVQRRWIEYLLDPARMPNRDQWVEHIQALLKGKKRLKLASDIDIWWQQMLWLHVCKKEFTEEQASEFVKFRKEWLASVVAEVPNQVADHLPEWISKKTFWSLEKVVKEQEKYRREVELSLPTEVPSGDKSLVAQAVLEMLVFAGGLSVPQTLHSAVAVLFSPNLLPSPVEVSEDNVESFVYEVTRLFPAVQGFCYWQSGQRQILSLNAALRDPAVWGHHSANRFSLKDVNLYRTNHVGFANQAISSIGDFDSKSCPGYRIALDVVQAFVLVLSSWSKCASGPLKYWAPLSAPKGIPVPKWWSSFEIECFDWLDGDQAGEDLLIRDLNPIEVGRLLAHIERQPGYFVKLVDSIGLKKLNLSEQRRLSRMDVSTRMFYEITKIGYKGLGKHVGSDEPDTSPAKMFTRFFEIVLDDGAETIRLPLSDKVSKKIRESLTDTINVIYQSVLDDSVDDTLIARTAKDRQAGIVLCQVVFKREEKVELTASQIDSRFQSDSYLPKPPSPFPDLTADDSQVAIARCGMGQLFLRRNHDEKLKAYGEVICDASLLGGFEVRPAFERLGASAFFKCESSKWQLTAIDWKHGEKILFPGDPLWEHVKWVWRCSLFTHMTAIQHLTQCHWIKANGFSTSLRENLDPQHPIRRLLGVFSYNTPSINAKSASFLYSNNGVLHRMTPFPYSELKRIFTVAANSFKFQTWPQFYQEMDLPDSIKGKLPIFEDGLQLWEVLHDFFDGYVNIFYATDDVLARDSELREYWKFSRAKQYTRNLPSLSKRALIEQLTQACFDVTAFHELVGGVVDYTTDPAGASMQVRTGLDMSDLQELILVNSLVASTGSPVPMFIASNQEGDKDWLHHLDLTSGSTRPEWAAPENFTKITALHKRLIEQLKAMSREIQERNALREHPFRRFDPVFFERSVSL